MTTADLSPLIAIARAHCEGADAAHDFQPVSRVARSARTIAERERADVEIAETAAWLHELFNHPKNHPESHRSGEICAEHARAVLEDGGWPAERAARVAECIRTHAFSSGLRPE